MIPGQFQVNSRCIPGGFKQKSARNTNAHSDLEVVVAFGFLSMVFVCSLHSVNVNRKRTQG